MIRYDACATRVRMTPDQVEAFMPEPQWINSTGFGSLPIYDPHFEEWAKQNLHNAWGRQLIKPAAERLTAQLAVAIEFWFESDLDATLFKMRWFNPPEQDDD